MNNSRDQLLANERRQWVASKSLAASKSIRRRSKRKIVRFDIFPERKWRLPIKYKIDLNFSDVGRGTIVTAVDEWERATCVRFTMVNPTQKFKEPHILFRSGNSSSTVTGKYVLTLQHYITLKDPDSFYLWGVVGHEMGHALGLEHEHQRPDRDRHLIVFHDNIDEPMNHNFNLFRTSYLTTYGLPYDLGSIMQYAPDSFLGPHASNNCTMLPRDPTQLGLMGQNTEISFYDAKAVNMAYCGDVCTASRPIVCLHDGYQDPNKCYQCRCPPRYGGTKCEHLSAQSPGCTPGLQYLFLTEKRPQVELSSPNYGNGRYSETMGCTWQVTTTVPSQITFWFQERPFGILCLWPPSCAHWVEVWYLPSYTIHGQRFCGFTAPSNKFVAVSATVTVLFSAPHSGLFPLDIAMFPFLGFRLYLKVDVKKEIEQEGCDRYGIKNAIRQGISIRCNRPTELDVSQSKASPVLVQQQTILLTCCIALYSVYRRHQLVQTIFTQQEILSVCYVPRLLWFTIANVINICVLSSSY